VYCLNVMINHYIDRSFEKSSSKDKFAKNRYNGSFFEEFSVTIVSFYYSMK